MKSSLKLQAALASAMMQNPGMIVGDPILPHTPTLPLYTGPVVGGHRKVGASKSTKAKRSKQKQARKKNRK